MMNVKGTNKRTMASPRVQNVGLLPALLGGGAQQTYHGPTSSDGSCPGKLPWHD